ncbi:lipase family protein [Gorillibacterium timonense]|uniref:lipase family protein n=1 Tax=Gorillibacterium timonense TaxID=1689269 RepID=UPI00071C33AE|nr:lipase family protein [Gorillibacterium timonense]
MLRKSDIEQRAIFLAAVCSQTYAQYSNPNGSFVLPEGYSLRHTIQATSFSSAWEPFGFILESPLEILIAFRGTSSANDWISDVIASQQKFRYVHELCMTHRGFTDIYSSARDGIFTALTQLPTDKGVTITGHSLGAALATLCAFDIATNTDFPSFSLYTFGSPRVGDPAFSEAFAGYVPDSYRFANLFDVVTYVPPTAYKLPKQEITYFYRHVPGHISMSFQNGAFGLNHVISSYFTELAKLQPTYALALCRANPGFCPAMKEDQPLTPGKDRDRIETVKF